MVINWSSDDIGVVGVEYDLIVKSMDSLWWVKIGSIWWVEIVGKKLMIWFWMVFAWFEQREYIFKIQI